MHKNELTAMVKHAVEIATKVGYACHGISLCSFIIIVDMTGVYSCECFQVITILPQRILISSYGLPKAKGSHEVGHHYQKLTAIT